MALDLGCSAAQADAAKARPSAQHHTKPHESVTLQVTGLGRFGLGWEALGFSARFPGVAFGEGDP